MVRENIQELLLGELIFKDYFKKGKKIMIAVMTFAVVAIMIAQAVSVENKMN